MRIIVPMTSIIIRPTCDSGPVKFEKLDLKNYEDEEENKNKKVSNNLIKN